MRTALLLAALGIPMIPYAQIANNYPHDVGIESDPDVLYVERFDGSLDDVTSRYEEVLHPEEFLLDTDIPAGSVGPHSLRISNTSGVNNGGHLYRSFSPGFDSVVYVRYYVKYPAIADGQVGHQAIWFGGYNPAIPYPFPQAGYCGLGDSRLSVAFENVWEGDAPGLDTYLYWADMHSFDGGYTCFGNTMITQWKLDHADPPSPDAPTSDPGEWMCIEVMVKLNDPVISHNGELRIWKNGEEIGHWGPGFPRGHWFKDKWYNNPADQPFEGFRWRTDPDLDINWLWIEYYHDWGPESHVKFSNIVMAKSYIGPIHDPGTSVGEAAQGRIAIYPNPAKDRIEIAGGERVDRLVLHDALGRRVLDRGPSSSLDLAGLRPGLYVLDAEAAGATTRHRIVIHE